MEDVELYCFIQRGVSVILPALFDKNGVDKIIETPVNITVNST